MLTDGDETPLEGRVTLCGSDVTLEVSRSAKYSGPDLPFPLLLLTVLLLFILAALIMGVRRDILASRTSPTPERIGLGVVIPLALGITFIVVVEIVAFRFWDSLATSAGP